LHLTTHTPPPNPLPMPSISRINQHHGPLRPCPRLLLLLPGPKRLLPLQLVGRLHPSRKMLTMPLSWAELVGSLMVVDASARRPCATRCKYHGQSWHADVEMRRARSGEAASRRVTRRDWIEMKLKSMKQKAVLVCSLHWIQSPRRFSAHFL